MGIALIHFSTDCVFDGSRGGYKETDRPDAQDLYGRTKALGEVTGAGVLTIRCSVIGRELAHSQGLLEWLISVRGKVVRGFRRATFTGITTHEAARVIDDILTRDCGLGGLYHVAGPRVSKYELLTVASQELGLGIEVIPDDSVVYDRSLDDSALRQLSGYQPRSWPDMLAEVAQEMEVYDRWRTQHCR